MPCYFPLRAFWSKNRNAQGNFYLVFSKWKPGLGEAIDVPCGKCIGCKLERSRQMAMRAMHENSLHDESAFITLTYHPEWVPPGGSLCIEDLQKFFKRLRKKLGGKRISYLACGEYGERFSRPHYHALVFGFDFPDRLPFKNRNGMTVWRSAMLEQLWPFGFSEIGTVTFESAAYIARYVLKKVTGAKAEDHYRGRRPEFLTCSRRPALGLGFLEKFGEEVYRDDSCLNAGKEVKVPKYYDRKLKEKDEKKLEKLKEARKAAALARSKDSTPSRLRVREKVAKARVKLYLKRGLENE